MVNPTKTCLIVKETFLSEANEIFKNTNIRITTEGHPHLDAALGTQTYVDSYVGEKVNEFSEEVKRLSCIAKSQPHAAYSALTHGMASKWTYLTRTIFNTSHLIKPLGDAIRTYLIPALTGRAPPNDVERDLLSLPCRLGGIGICNPSKTAAFEYSASQRVTKPLCQLILQQDPTYSFKTCEAQSQAKFEVHEERRKKQSADASALRSSLPPLKFAMSLTQEKGASNWLTALPIEEHGFTLHKGAYRDALALRYGWQPNAIHYHCTCDESFSIPHVFSCARGVYPSIRHNEIRDLTVHLLTEVCHCVSTEPTLQPIAGEVFNHATAITEDGARLDIAVNGFWGGRLERKFF